MFYDPHIPFWPSPNVTSLLISLFTSYICFRKLRKKENRNKNEMYFPIKLIILFSFSILFCVPSIALESESTDPIPSPWPHQFHATTLMNYTGGLRIVDIWYDWPNKRYLHINQYQLGKKLYDVEWDNGTSFYFTLDSTEECTIRHFPVGILRPNWLEGATYLGHKYKDGFLCNVWEKVDFIEYYEDVLTKIPVYWQFYDGLKEHIMTFEVGKVLEDSKWQAPAYCFKEMEKGKKSLQEKLKTTHFPLGRTFMRDDYLEVTDGRVSH